MIRYNRFSCDTRYIGWTICLNIFGEKDQKRLRTVMAQLYSIDFVICVGHLADLVTNLLRHWWWTVIFVFNWMMQLIRTHITFGSIVLLLHWILSKFFSLSVRGHFLNFESTTNKSAFFQTRSYVGVSSKQCIVYRLTAVYRYVHIYWYIDSPLAWT